MSFEETQELFSCVLKFFLGGEYFHIYRNIAMIEQFPYTFDLAFPNNNR